MSSVRRLHFNDAIGATCSALCMVHCLAPAILVGIGNAGLVGFFADEEWVHFALLGVSFAIIALVMSAAFRVHRRVGPCLLSGLGLSLLIAGVWAHALETQLTVAGAVLVVTAHLWNSWNLRQVARRAIS